VNTNRIVKQSLSTNRIARSRDRYWIENHRHHLAAVLDPCGNAVWGD
jgi:hypothetical protein